MESQIFVTIVEPKGSYLRIMGQIDKNLAILIESSLHDTSAQFDQKKYMLSRSDCQEGVLCCAKYKDGDYYRAQITDTSLLNQDVVEVFFIDYGNRERTVFKDLRGMTCFPANIVSLPPLAREFIIAGYTHAGSKWDDAAVEDLSENIKYVSYNYKIVGQMGNNVLIQLFTDKKDVFMKYVQQGIVAKVSIEVQQAALQKAINKQISNSQSKSPEAIITYRSTPILVNEDYKAYISYVTDGPCLFSVQLKDMEEKLDNLMRDLNSPGMKLQRLDDFPIPGSVCLAQSLEDNYICRAVVTSTVDSRIKVFYVDFGNTEELQCSRLYQMPVKYLIPKVMATRFGLAGLRGCNVNMEMKVAFKDFVTDKVLTMRKVAQTADSALPLCELRDKNNLNALEFIKKAAVNSYSDPVSLVKGIFQEVNLSYAHDCKQFFVQLKSKDNDLTSLMKQIQRKCSSKKQMDRKAIVVGSPCIAFNELDMLYYRAEIMAIEEERVLCKLVDFGSRCYTIKNDLVAADPELMMMLKPQAIECCLNGYQNIKNIDPVWDIFFRKVAEKVHFSLKLVETVGSKHLVDLYDEKNLSVNTLIYDQLGTKSHHKNLNQATSVNAKSADHNLSNNSKQWTDQKQTPNGEGNWREIRSRNVRKSPSGDKRNKNAEKVNQTKANSRNHSKTTKIERNTNNIGQGQAFKEPRQEREPLDNKQKKRSDQHRKPSREGSEISFSGSDSSFGKHPRKTIKQVKQEVEYASANDTYKEYEDQTPLCLHKITVCWFYDPSNFYCQLYREQVFFAVMMKEIQHNYKLRKPITEVAVGMPVIAQFADDGALYRAKVVKKLKTGAYVYFVDFGNLAASEKVYQIEKKHMQMPAQALRCSLPEIAPYDKNGWPKTEVFSNYFNKDVYSSMFAERKNNCYYIELLTDETTSTGSNLTVKNKLIQDKLLRDYVEDNTHKLNLLEKRHIRCKLVSIQNLSNIVVELEPNLQVTCSFFFLKSAIKDAVQILQKFLNKFIIIYVQTIANDKFIVIFYNEFGNIMKLASDDVGAKDYVSPVLPYPIIRSTIEGYVLNISGVSLFVKNKEFMEKSESLMKKMTKHYELTEYREMQMFAGKMVAFKADDCNWYRGRLLDKTGEMYSIHIVDYGCVEYAREADIRPLSDSFATYHEMITHVYVKNCAGIKRNDKVQLSSLHYVDGNLHGKLRVIEHSSEPSKEQTDDLFSCRRNVPKPEESQEPVAMEPKEARSDSKRFLVELSHFDNPNEFYLQLIDSLETIDLLQSKLQQEAPELPAVENITTGIVCAAIYSVDQLWYRAQVLDADSDITTVRFIDYGNTDVLNNASTVIKILPADMLTLDQHARRCSLYLSPVNGEWSTDACARFEQLTDGKSLEVNIVHEDEKSTYVELYANGESVGEVLMKEKLAARLNIETSSSCTGYFSHLNSPSEFWMQLESTCDDLEWIADQLEQAESYPVLENCAPGTLCAAIFAEDGNWYRARILSNTIAGIEVIFIDYGNSCTCSSLKELPEELIMVPALAQKCSLQKPPGILEWPADATKRLNEVSAEGLAIFTVYKLSHGETSIVQLMLEGEDISLKLLPQLRDVRICHINSFDEFYVQEVNDDLALIQDKLQAEAANYEEYTGNNKDDIIIANCDGIFYRCTKLDDKKVFLIDFGKVMESTVLKVCPEKMNAKSAPRCARLAKMQPLADFTWNDESLRKFNELMGDDIFQAEFIKDSAVVRIYFKYCDIRSQLPSEKVTPGSPKLVIPEKLELPEDAAVRESRSAGEGQLQYNNPNDVEQLATELKSEIMVEVEKKIGEISIKEDAKNGGTNVEHSNEPEERQAIAGDVPLQSDSSDLSVASEK